MGRQTVVDGHLAAAGLVEHRYLGAVAKGALAGHGKAPDILDDNIVGDVVAAYVIVDFAYEHIVAHGAVVQQGVINAAANGDGSRAHVHLCRGTEPHGA